MIGWPSEVGRETGQESTQQMMQATQKATMMVSSWPIWGPFEYQKE